MGTNPILKTAEAILDRALCIAGAVTFAQAPEFMQQYLQRLGGRLDEARRQLQQLSDVASRSGMTLQGLAADASSNSDPAVARLGGVVREASTRVDSLSAAEAALRHANLVSRPFVFIRHLDPSTAHATLAVFRPALPTTLEGALYAIVGMLALLGAYHGCVKYPVRRAWQARKIRAMPAAAQSSAH